MLLIHEIKLRRYQSLRFILFCSDKNFRNWPSNCAYKLRKFKQKGHTNEFLIKYMFSCILINIPFNLHTNLFSFLLECYFHMKFAFSFHAFPREIYVMPNCAFMESFNIEINIIQDSPTHCLISMRQHRVSIRLGHRAPLGEGVSRTSRVRVIIP